LDWTGKYWALNEGRKVQPKEQSQSFRLHLLCIAINIEQYSIHMHATANHEAKSGFSWFISHLTAYRHLHHQTIHETVQTPSLLAFVGLEDDKWRQRSQARSCAWHCNMYMRNVNGSNIIQTA